MTKKGQTRTPAEVFKRGGSHVDFHDNMKRGHKLLENDKRFQDLLDRLEEAENKQSQPKPLNRPVGPGAPKPSDGVD